MDEDSTETILEELRAALAHVRRAEAAALAMRGADNAGGAAARQAEDGVRQIYAEMEKLHWAAGDALELIRPDGM